MPSIHQQIPSTSKTGWTRPLRSLVAACGVLLFGLLALAVSRRLTLPLDTKVMVFVHGYALPRLDQVMIAVTYLGSAMVLAPLEVVFLCWLIKRRMMGVALFLASAVGGGAILNSILKACFLRQRPALWDTLVSEESYSFPSGHSMHTMALLLSFALLLHGRRGAGCLLWPGFIMALLVGFSRVYLGVHYPSDVLGGWLAAVGWVFLCTLPLSGESGISPWRRGRSP